MIELTHPVYLWALAGLAVPLAIHLLSRKEGKIIKIGSLRHVEETSTQQFRGIKLNEILLLILRSLLIILFVFLLSGLHMKEHGNRRWLVIEDGLEQMPSVKVKVDSLSGLGFEVHALQKDFPLLEEKTADHAMDYWQLITGLGSRNLDSAIVFSTTALKNFSGQRVAMPSFVNWITVPTQPTSYVAYAWKQGGSTWSRQGYSQADKTWFETKQLRTPDSIVIQKPAINVSVVYDGVHESEKRIIVAALNAIANTLPVDITINESTAETADTSADWLFWLAERKPVLRDSLPLILLQLQQADELIVQTQPHRWAITQPLSLDVARKEHLTLLLATLLFPEQKFGQHIQHHDQRILPENTLLSGNRVQQAALLSDAPPATWIVILFLITLMTERWVAYKRNQ